MDLISYQKVWWNNCVFAVVFDVTRAKVFPTAENSSTSLWRFSITLGMSKWTDYRIIINPVPSLICTRHHRARLLVELRSIIQLFDWYLIRQGWPPRQSYRSTWDRLISSEKSRLTTAGSGTFTCAYMWPSDRWWWRPYTPALFATSKWVLLRTPWRVFPVMTLACNPSHVSPAG